jgi:replicative DNA helicase Mcm
MARPENSDLIDAFDEFYRNYCRDEIAKLAQNYPDEQRSLYIDWQELYRFDPDLADDYRAHPNEFQDYAEEALRLYDLPVDLKLGQAVVRIENISQNTRINEIRSADRGTLISVPGTVRSASSVSSEPTQAAWECQRCGTLTRIPQRSIIHKDDVENPHECQGCERQGPFRMNEDQSEFADVRRFRIESHLADKEVDTPESIIAIAEGDIIDDVQPGETVQVTGVLNIVDFGKSRPQLDATIDDKYLKVSTFRNLEGKELVDISDLDKREIVTKSEEQDLFEQLTESIAPHVPGNEDVKLAVALQQFGGVKKVLPDGTVIPGTIHIGLISDPGTFADEIIEYAARIAPKSVSVNGTDTTQVGLTTAAYVSSSSRKNWELDAGALVLADNGLACLARIDNLDGEARAALESVMRSQEVKASKGTATQTLPAETAVLASLAPKYGRFDKYEPNNEQIDLEPALTSRFDLLFTMTDQPDLDADREEAKYILETNYAGEVSTEFEESNTSKYTQEEVEHVTEEVTPPIDPDLLRKYITYANSNCFPTPLAKPLLTSTPRFDRADQMNTP